MGVILLMTGYHEEPIAIGSIIKLCNFLMKWDKTYLREIAFTNRVIIGQVDRDMD